MLINKEHSTMVKKGAKKKSLVRTVKRIVGNMTEDKVNYLSDQVGATVSSTVTNILLNGVVQGTGLTERVGNRLKWKNLDLRLFFQNVAATTQRFRVMLVWDRQPNGAVPTLAQLLYNSTAAQTYSSPPNINGFKRFRILKDVNYELGVQGGATDTIVQKHLRIRKRFKSFSTVYNAGGSTINQINTGSLYLCMYCNNNAQVSYVLESALYYEDA